MNLVEYNLWVWLPWKSLMNSLLWINKDVWIIDGCWIWCLSWCGVFPPLLELYEVVELLWWCCWCVYMLCAYMLLVNFLTCYWCWVVGVSMYKNMLVWIVEVVWKYALLLLSHRSTHCWCRISYPCWWRILCIQLFGLIIRVVYDVQLASGVTTSQLIWYHTCLGTLHV